MAWLVLTIGGLMEMVWAIGLKYSYTDGSVRFVPAGITVVAMAASVLFLWWAMRTIPVGTAYAAWTGIGAVGTAILGIVMFGDPATMARIGCLFLIIIGIVGLKLVS